MAYTDCKYPEGTRVRYVNSNGHWHGVTGVITDPAKLIMNGRPVGIRPRNAVKMDKIPPGWILEWFHCDDESLEKVDALTPFEADLIAYIDSEKRLLGLL